MTRFKAAVIGGSGYGANEIIRRLLVHPEVELVRVASIDYVDEPLSAAHPNLTGMSELCFRDIPPEEAAASIPPAKTFENPRFTIIGMVKTPVDNTLTTGPPVMVPNMAELTMAAWAGPPRRLRVQRKASLIRV